MPKRVEVNKTLRGRMNFKGRLLKKQANSVTKLQKKDTDLRPKKTIRREEWQINQHSEMPTVRHIKNGI